MVDSQITALLQDATGVPSTPPIPATLPDAPPDVIGEMELSIVQQLKAIEQFAGIPVIAMPGKVADLAQPLPRGAVIVHYLKSLIDKTSTGMRRPVQAEQAIFSINVTLLNLRTHTGVYQVLRAVRLLLLGFRAKHSTGALTLREPHQFTRLDPKNRLWEYRMDVAVPCSAIAVQPEDAQLFLLRLKLLDNQGDLFMEIPNAES